MRTRVTFVDETLYVTRWLTFAAVAASIACGGSTAPAIRTSVRLEPVTLPAQQGATQSAPTQAAAMPALPVDQTAVSAGARRLDHFSATNDDVRTVVRGLAANFGLGYQIDPEVQGRVSANLNSISLEDALSTILKPKGYTFSIQNDILRVGPARMETRIFSLDYVALSRIGTSTTVIQRRLGGAGSGGVVGGGGLSGISPTSTGQATGFSGGDAIVATTVADLWNEIRVAMTALVFSPDVTAEGAARTAARVVTEPATQPSGMAGPSGLGDQRGGAYSQIGPDGSRLIINPIAGTILVTAFPDRLQEVDTFIKTFASSVQRQVLIEARFVEVNLDRSLQYGVDWNVVSGGAVTPGAVSGGVNSSTGNVTLKLAGGNTQITAVLQALSTQGDVRVLSSPRTVALNNQPAVFDVTTDEVFFTVTQQPILGPTGLPTGQNNTQVIPQQVSVGIVLHVVPQISADNTMTMNIRPVVTSVASVNSIELDNGTKATAPSIQRRETDTMARLRSGETIVIGGLMQTKSERTESGIPVLRSIPVIGKLFSHTNNTESRSELVIFLTPTIVAGQPPSM